MLLSIVFFVLLCCKFVAGHYEKFDIKSSDAEILAYATNLVNQLVNQRGVRKEVFVLGTHEPMVDEFLKQIAIFDVVITVFTWDLFSGYDYEGYGAVAAYVFNAPVMVLFENTKIEGFAHTIYDFFNQPGTKAGFKIITIITDFSLDLIPANMTRIIMKSFIKYHDTLVLFKLDHKLQAFLYQYNFPETLNVTNERHARDIFRRRRKLLQIYQKDDPPRSRVIDGKVTGMDGLYLENYIKYMQVDYVLVSAEYEKQHFNSDLTFNVKDLNSMTIDSSALFYISQFWRQCFLVPKATPDSIIDSLMQIIAPSAIYVLLSAQLLAGLLIYYVLRLRPNLRMKIHDVYFALARSSLTNSVKHRMRTPFERIAFTAHLVGSFLVLNATLCFMKQFLVSPRHNDINTIDQLNRSELTILGSDVKQYQAAQWFGQAFADKILPVHNIHKHPINRSFAYILPENDIDQYVHSNENFVNGTQQMHKMKEYFSQYFRGYMGKIDDYNYETMHFYLSAIEESGIRQHWKWKVRDSSRNPELWATDKVPISLHQLRKLFWALLVGYGLALLAFIGELLVAGYH